MKKLLDRILFGWRKPTSPSMRDLEQAAKSEREDRVRFIEETIRREVTRDEEH